VKKRVSIVATVIVLALVAGGAYFYWRVWPGLRPAIGPVPLRAVPLATAPKAVKPAVNETGLPLVLPDGFRIQTFASNLGNARQLAFDPGGVLTLSLTADGEIVSLPDRDGNGQADRVDVLLTGLNEPSGLTYHRGFLYVAENDKISRYPYTSNPSGPPTIGPGQVLSDLPSDGEHFTRTVTFGPDGKMYIACGSSSNTGPESDSRRAAVMRFNDDGTGMIIFASGLRNTVGLTWHPVTGELWGVDNGRDYLSDDLPPDEVNIIRLGNDYGWPNAYGDKIPDPAYNDASRAAVTKSPLIQIQAHSAPLGLCFYSGNGFLPGYGNNLFIAYHGSWNRTVPTGYKIVRFVMTGPTYQTPGPQQDFITGWLTPAGAVGRPVAIIQGGDGALYISDDKAGAVYRVSRL
jgi:glucose/arabinose dehydrogenase